MKTELLEIFTEKQINAIKAIVKVGMWGNTDMKFGTDTDYEAFGFFTKGVENTKEFSGICSGISKKIEEIKTPCFYMDSDWWSNGGKDGGMLFINMDLLECNYQELLEWAKK